MPWRSAEQVELAPGHAAYCVACMDDPSSIKGGPGYGRKRDEKGDKENRKKREGKREGQKRRARRKETERKHSKEGKG